MNKRPLFVAAIFFVFGIVVAKYMPDSVGFLYIFIVTLIFILSSLIFSRFHKVSNIFLILSIIFFAILLYINSNTFPEDHISHFLGEDNLKTEIVGVIKSPAITRKPYYGKINSTYLFEIEAVKGQSAEGLAHGEDGWTKVTGLAQIRLQTEKDYRYGDRLLVKGTIRNPKSEIRNPKQIQNQQFPKTHFNYAEYLENQNIFGIINASEKSITLLSHNYKSNLLLRYVYLIREKLKDRFLEKMPLESGAFLRAILLGDRSELPRHIQESFRNSGTMHILAISGLHVGIVASVIILLLKLLRFPREAYYFGTIIFLMFLSVLTGGNPPVVRATVMITVFLIGMLLGRSVDVYNSIGVAGLFILVRSPKDIFDVGFQLSFLAVLSMLYFVPKFMKLIKEDVNIYIKKFFYIPLTVSISASLGTFLLIIYYFRMFTPIAIVANLFIVPAMFVQLVGGLCFSVLCWLPLVSDVLAQFNNILAQIIFWLADFFGALKFGHFYLG